MENKLYQKQYREAHKEEMKEYSSKYYQEHKKEIINKAKTWSANHPQEREISIKKANNSEKAIVRRDKWIGNNNNLNKKIKNQSRKKNYWKNKVKVLAVNKANKKIPLNKDCDICHSTENLQRHHWRYDTPLLVNTLCKDCHVIQHLNNFEISRYAGGDSFGR